MNCVPSWQVIWRSWYQWVPWIANLLKMTWWISKSMAFRRTFHNKTTGSSGVCCSFLFFGRKTKYMNILPWWIFLADYGQEHWKRKGWTWRMDISSSLHKAFPILHAEGFSFSLCGGGNKLRVQDLFRFFSFQNDLWGCFLKRETPRDSKKREQRCSVFYGEFSWECPKTKNLQPHGKHLQLLNDLKFPAPWKPTKSGRSESWWKTASVDPKRLARCSFHLCHRLRRRRFFFHGFFFSIWTLRCVSSRKSKCQTFGKRANCPPRHCEKNSQSSNWIAFCQCFFVYNIHVEFPCCTASIHWFFL